jgi:hypothetical protein
VAGKRFPVSGVFAKKRTKLGAAMNLALDDKRLSCQRATPYGLTRLKKPEISDHCQQYFRFRPVSDP